MDLDLARMLDLAEAAATEGGRVVVAGFGTSASESKGAGDYVTEVDHASERAIAEVLLAGAPEVPVIGEEGGGDPADLHWLVDPLDGTANFLHRFPAVGVSIALIRTARPVVGVVHAPFLGQTWTAARGRGTRHQGAAVRVSDRPVERAIVATGFPFRRKQVLSRYLEAFRAGLERFEDLRRPGAASLDLAWVANGVFEGFFELGLAPWDVAAGALLVEEAGGIVSDWDGGDGYLGGDILAGTPAVHETLLQIARGT